MTALDSNVRRLPNPAVGQILRRYRSEAGLTQWDLSVLAALSQSYVQRLEAGKRSIGPRALARIGRVLGQDFVMEVLAEVADGEEG